MRHAVTQKNPKYLIVGDGDELEVALLGTIADDLRQCAR